MKLAVNELVVSASTTTGLVELRNERAVTLTTLVDEFLPVYDVSDEVATVVEADARTTWDAVIDADLIE